MNVSWNQVTIAANSAVIFETDALRQEKNAERTFWAQTEENLQLPEFTALAAFQGHAHCFAATAGKSPLKETWLVKNPQPTWF